MFDFWREKEDAETAGKIKVIGAFVNALRFHYGRDLAEKLVADLGSGPGVLSIGTALMGAAHVVGFELDSDALETARSTCEEMEIDTIDFVHADVTRLCDQV